MDQDGSGKEHWEKGGTKSRDGHPMELTFLQVSLRRKNWKSYSQFLVWSVPQVGMTKNRKDFSDGAKKNRELLQTRYLYLIFYNFAILLNSKGSRCRESGLAL